MQRILLRCFLALFCAVPLAAQAGTFAAGDTSGSSGSSITVNLSWTGDGTTSGFQYDLSYDSAILTNADITNCLSGAASLSLKTCIQLDSSTIRITAANLAGAIPDLNNFGSIGFTISNTTASSATITVTAVNPDVNCTPAGQGVCNGSDGTVTITGPVVTEITVTTPSSIPEGGTGNASIACTNATPSTTVALRSANSAVLAVGSATANCGDSVPLNAGQVDTDTPVELTFTSAGAMVNGNPDSATATVTVTDVPPLPTTITISTPSAIPEGETGSASIACQNGTSSTAVDVSSANPSVLGVNPTTANCGDNVALTAGQVDMDTAVDLTFTSTGATINGDSNSTVSTVTVTDFDPITAIPTLSEWAMLILASLLVIGGFITLRQNRGAA